MFLDKIGKSRHKFKAKIVFVKVINKSTEKGSRFRVKVQRQRYQDFRGSHEFEGVSNVVKKGVGKFSTQEYTIPLTLFYDEDKVQVQYLRKEATIKVYEESEQQKNKIGWTTIDMAEYALNGAFTLQIQLDSKEQQNPILFVNMNIQKQDDDSKSIQTYSSNNQNKKTEERQTPLRFQREDEISTKPSTKKQQNQKITVQKNHKSYNPNKNPDNHNNPNNLNENEKQEEKPSKELELFLVKNTLRQKEKQLIIVTKKCEGFEKTINQLIEKNIDLNRQREDKGQQQKWKKVVMDKQLEYDDLRHKYKEVVSRQQGNEQTISKQRKQIREWKEKMTTYKYKMAKLMQQCFQKGDQQVIELVSKYLQQ